MMHTHRRWCLHPVATPEQLARLLTEHTWTLCTGFYVLGHDDYLFLNDATHEDGAAEFAVLKGRMGEALHLQVESITFSWCSQERALALIRHVLAGEYDGGGLAALVCPKLETTDKHKTCHLCA